MAISDALVAGQRLAQGQGGDPLEDQMNQCKLQAQLYGGQHKQLDAMSQLKQMFLKKAQPYLMEYLGSGKFDNLLQQGLGLGPMGRGGVGSGASFGGYGPVGLGGGGANVIT